MSLQKEYKQRVKGKVCSFIRLQFSLLKVLLAALKIYTVFSGASRGHQTTKVECDLSIFGNFSVERTLLHKFC